MSSIESSATSSSAAPSSGEAQKAQARTSGAAPFPEALHRARHSTRNASQQRLPAPIAKSSASVARSERLARGVASTREAEQRHRLSRIEQELRALRPPDKGRPGEESACQQPEGADALGAPVPGLETPSPVWAEKSFALSATTQAFERVALDRELPSGGSGNSPRLLGQVLERVELLLASSLPTLSLTLRDGRTVEISRRGAQAVSLRLNARNEKDLSPGELAEYERALSKRGIQLVANERAERV